MSTNYIVSIVILRNCIDINHSLVAISTAEYVQWNLRNKTTIGPWKKVLFWGGPISENHNSCIHGFGTKPKRSYFKGGRFIEVVI